MPLITAFWSHNLFPFLSIEHVIGEMIVEELPSGAPVKFDTNPAIRCVCRLASTPHGYGIPARAAWQFEGSRFVATLWQAGVYAKSRDCSR